ncbi:MAG TPA: type II secretion system F family protein [Mycobacteriales bacterium]|nr:type II secretion system F family protein [Mycobacteriales bacterium]
MTVWLAAVAAALAVATAGRRGAVRRRLSTLTDSESESTPSPLGLRRGWRPLLAVVIGTAVAAARVNVAIPVLVVVASTVGVRAWSARQSAQQRAATAAATVELTAALAAELRAGRTPALALAAAGPWAGPLRDAVSAAAVAVAAGMPAADGLLLAANEPGADALRQVAAAWRVTETTGGRLAAVLDRLTDTLDAERELQLELDSALAAPRATVVLLAGLPLMGLALGQSIGAHPFRLLLHRPLGWGLLAVAGLLDAAGVIAMSRITRWATRW